MVLILGINKQKTYVPCFVENLAPNLGSIYFLWKVVKEAVKPDQWVTNFTTSLVLKW